jgi:hypothetical protein
MLRKVAALTILLLAVTAAFSGPRADAQSIGVAPGSIDLTEALRGGEYDENFRIINERTEEQVYRLAITGEAAPWVSVYLASNRAQPVTEVTSVPEEGVRLIARVAVPPEAPNRLHVAEIAFDQVITDTEGEEQVVASGIALDVNVNVTGTQRLEARVFSEEVRDTEVDLPLRVRLGVENTGNVIGEPTVNLTIRNDGGEEVGTTFLEHEAIQIGQTTTLSTEWDSTGNGEGDYEVDVSLLFGEDEVYAQTFPFHIYPRGYFTRQGEFESLTLEVHPNPGGTAKLVAVFNNTGEIDTLAHFQGEVYRGDDLIGPVESEELLIPPEQNTQLEVFVQTEDKGVYTVQGNIIYEGKETSTRGLEFKVPPDLGSGGLFGRPWWQIAVGAALAAAIVASLIYQVRKRQSPEQSPA